MGSSSTPPSQPAFLAKSEPELLEHFKEKIQKKPKALEPHAAAAASCLRGLGASPPSPSRLLLIHMHGCKLNVSGASMQPEGTLASQDKGRRFGMQQAQTGRAQGREGLTPHRDVAVGTQLLQEAAVSWRGW